ncbi:MAG: hypothetical protein GXZ02_00650 [Clostridiales bacterium]|nr:hypothetical protein [Clostridiales bacterium]
MLCESNNKSQTNPQTKLSKNIINITLSYWYSRSDSIVSSSNEEIIRKLYDLVKKRLEICAPDLLKQSTKVRRGIQVSGLIPVEFKDDVWVFSFIKLSFVK